MAPDQPSMAVRIRVRTTGLPVALDPTNGYRLRPLSFLSSACLHAAAILALLSIPVYRYTTKASDRPIYDELIQPEEHKIVWYGVRRPLPPVNAVVRVGTSPTPRGRELSKDVLVATSPNPTSAKQFIWRPVPKLEIRKDLAAPNLVLKMATAIPLPAPPPPEPKKLDQPNTEGSPAKEPNLSPPTPKGDVKLAQDNPVQPVEIPKPRKAFVPPPPSKQPPRLPLPVTVAELPAPDVSITGSSSPHMALLDGLGTAGLSKGAPPPPNAPPGATNSAGNAKTDIAIAGLNPTDKLTGPLPDGARPGQFSRAPTLGEPSTGDVGNGIGVPNLTIREGSKVAEPPRVSASRKTTLYADKLRGIPLSTLSVPLRPAARTIPRAIDARFAGRNVYTMVIPIEDIAPYSGDWIVWFAERQAKPGDTPFVRAPVPLRKLESVQPVPPGAHTELRVQVAAVIRQNGKFEDLTLLRNLTPGLEQAIIEDLNGWEFKPATRDGSPVDVDVVLEVPFSLPPQIARSN